MAEAALLLERVEAALALAQRVLVALVVAEVGALPEAAAEPVAEPVPLPVPLAVGAGEGVAPLVSEPEAQALLDGVSAALTLGLALKELPPLPLAAPLPLPLPLPGAD